MKQNINKNLVNSNPISEEYIPSFAIFDLLRQKLSDLEFKHEVAFKIYGEQLEEYKRGFLGILEDNITYDEEGYAQWLQENEERINEEIEKIGNWYLEHSSMSSHERTFNIMISNLALLLNMGEMPMLFDDELGV